MNLSKPVERFPRRAEAQDEPALYAIVLCMTILTFGLIAAAVTLIDARHQARRDSGEISSRPSDSLRGARLGGSDLGGR